MRQPEGNGVAERFIRTLKEKLSWVRYFETIEELRLALLEFAAWYNTHWLVARHGHRSRNRLGLKPQRLAADGSYGTGPFLSWLMERGVEPHVPVLERKHQTKGKLTRDAFTFDRKRNLFVCPTGRELTYRGAHYAARVHTYRSNAADCAPARCGKTAPADASAPSCACSTRTPATTPENCAIRPPTLSPAASGRRSRCYSLTSSDT